MTNPVPVPDAVLSSDFPATTDRQAGTFNTKAFNWANSARAMSVRDREIATATYTNALSAEANALVAAQAAGDAVPAAAVAVQKAQEASDSADAAELSRVLAARLNLGPYSTPPTTDNEGGVLIEGATYWDTTLGKWRVWTGTAWGDGISAVAGVSSLNGQTGDLTITQGEVRRLNKSSAYTLVSADKTSLVNASGAWALSLSPAATLGDGWWVYVRNTGNGDITIAADGAETIDGAATYVLKPGFAVLLQCDGTDFTVLELKKRTYSQRLQIESTQDVVVPADTYVIRGYAVGAGGDGGAAVASTSSGAGGSGGGMAYGDIAVTPGETLSVTIANRIAKVSRGATDLLVGNPAAHSTTTTPGAVGTASKHSSVTNGGAYSGGVGGAGLTGTSASGGAGASSGSPLGIGVAGGSGNATIAHGGSGWGGGSGGTGNQRGGGGVGGPSDGLAGGPGLPEGAPVIDPLLRDCVAPPNDRQGVSSNGAAGRPGQGGSHGTGNGGNGGFGGGGGGAGGAGNGGNGGFGGGGGVTTATGNGGNGGFGGGGAGGRVSNTTTRPAGTGGAAAVILIWD